MLHPRPVRVQVHICCKSVSVFFFQYDSPVLDLVTVFVEINSFLFPTPEVCLHWVLLPTPSRELKSVLCLLSAQLVTK